MVVNLVYLHAWANFNFLMMLNTQYTAMLTMASLMILIKDNVWLHADYSWRLFAFIMSLITTTIFFGHLVGVLYKLYQGIFNHTVNLRSIFNILSIYTLVLEFGSVIPAIHIFLFEALALDSNSIFHPGWGWWNEPKSPDHDHEDHENHDDHDEDDDKAVL